MRRALLLSLFTLLTYPACVPVPPEMLPKAPGSEPATPTAFPDIEPGGTSMTSLHFIARGYSDSDLRSISGTAENLYNKIGADTGLYSYLAGQTYTLVVYKDQDEYMTKTKQPNGSRAVAAGTALYTYPGPDLTPALAHQLMHLIFNSYMGDKAAASLLWLREGLAMHEEVAQMSEIERVTFQTTQNNKLRTDRTPFSQMTFFAGSNEERRREEAWYLQVESVVSFLLKQGSSLAFVALLNELRNGSTMDRALANNYAGKFRGLADFETSWQASI